MNNKKQANKYQLQQRMKKHVVILLFNTTIENATEFLKNNYTFYMVETQNVRHTFPSGWTFDGTVMFNRYVYLGKFFAYHQQYGKVFTSFTDDNNVIYATNPDAFYHFIQNHSPQTIYIPDFTFISHT
jgi:hypothetical protein